MLLSLLVSTGTALAQPMALAGDTCVPLGTCGTDLGNRCPDGDDHQVMLGTACFCAPGADGDLTPPTLCCGATGTSCAPGTMCTLFTDAIGGVCLGSLTPVCGATATAVSRATVIECHTTPDGNFSPYFRDGDCDGDGVPNGREVLDRLRSPCEPDDLHRCLTGGVFTNGECCTLAVEPGACCVEAGGGADCCLAQTDYDTCCSTVAAASPTDETTPLVCCINDPAVTDDATCCDRTDGMTGALCCEALGGPEPLCCASGIFCLPDAGVTPPPDGNVIGVDGGPVVREDGGTEPGMDAGPTVPPVEMPRFGGGGGAFCSVGRRTTASMPAIVGASFLLALVIPALRSRRRR